MTEQMMNWHIRNVIRLHRLAWMSDIPYEKVCMRQSYVVAFAHTPDLGTLRRTSLTAMAVPLVCL